MIDLQPSDEQRDLQAVVRRFAERDVGPAVAEAERAGGHLDRDTYLTLFRTAARIGLPGFLVAEQHGGAGRSALDNALVQEELGAVDVGFAASLNLTMTIPEIIAAGGSPEQCARWLGEVTSRDDLILAGALNEPGVPGSELFNPAPAPQDGIRTRAGREGDGYVLDGAKAGWVTNAGIASVYLVFARTSFDGPSVTTTSAFWVPADAPGLSVGSRTELLGMRSSWHAEVFLDRVRVGEADRLGEEGGGLALMQGASGAMAVGLAAAFVGLARRAHEITLAYADERVTWGRPIRQHQAVALQLADAAVELQTARLLVWDAALAVDRRDPTAVWKVPAAKSHAVDVAIAIAERAVKLHGASGVAVGVGPEKLLRDAWTGYSCDFTKEILRLGVAAAL